MIKYAFFLATVLGTSVAAFAALAPAKHLQSESKNVTVIYKNNALPAFEPFLVEYCGLEDCLDTEQSSHS